MNRPTTIDTSKLPAFDRAMREYFKAEYEFGRAAYAAPGFSLQAGRAAVPQERLDQLRQKVETLGASIDEAFWHTSKSVTFMLQREARAIGKQDVRSNVETNAGIQGAMTAYTNKISYDAIAEIDDYNTVRPDRDPKNPNGVTPMSHRELLKASRGEGKAVPKAGPNAAVQEIDPKHIPWGKPVDISPAHARHNATEIVLAAPWELADANNKKFTTNPANVRKILSAVPEKEHYSNTDIMKLKGEANKARDAGDAQKVLDYTHAAYALMQENLFHKSRVNDKTSQVMYPNDDAVYAKLKSMNSEMEKHPLPKASVASAQTTATPQAPAADSTAQTTTPSTESSGTDYTVKANDSLSKIAKNDARLMGLAKTAFPEATDKDLYVKLAYIIATKNDIAVADVITKGSTLKMPSDAEVKAGLTKLGGTPFAYKHGRATAEIMTMADLAEKAAGQTAGARAAEAPAPDASTTTTSTPTTSAPVGATRATPNPPAPAEATAGVVLSDESKALARAAMAATAKRNDVGVDSNNSNNEAEVYTKWVSDKKAIRGMFKSYLGIDMTDAQFERVRYENGRIYSPDIKRIEIVLNELRGDARPLVENGNFDGRLSDISEKRGMKDFFRDVFNATDVASNGAPGATPGQGNGAGKVQGQG